jgi:hypothetical protein
MFHLPQMHKECLKQAFTAFFNAKMIFRLGKVRSFHIAGNYKCTLGAALTVGKLVLFFKLISTI